MDERTETEPLVLRVARSGHPVAEAIEADAAIAARRYTSYVVRGPVYGLAAQGLDGDARWRVVRSVSQGSGQEARDSLNSHLWFRAKDDTDDPAERRALLRAVDVLERRPVDEVEAFGVRYRVVRADEYVYLDETGPEPPRPTDPDPVDAVWDDSGREAVLDEGFVIDHAAASGVMASAERLALMGLRYTSERYPVGVRADSEEAVVTHPGVVVLPPAFRTLEQTPGGWEMAGRLHATPHGARRSLYTALTKVYPRFFDLTDEEKRVLAEAAERFRAAQHANTLTAGEDRYLIARVGRAMRIGADGPEGPRPSDLDPHGPMKLHPTMDEHGTITFDDEPEED